MGSQEFDRASYKNLLKPKYWLSWLSLSLLAITAYTPAFIRDGFALFLAALVAPLNLKIKKIYYANLFTAFADMDEHRAYSIYKRSLAITIATALAYGQSSFLSRKALKRSYQVFGQEHLQAALDAKRPIIFVVPHAFAVDRCGLYMCLHDIEMCTMMKEQKNKVYNWFLNQARQRFGGKVYERSAGFKAIIKQLKAGKTLYFLPDEDLGVENSEFVPLLGVPKATLNSLPKLAKLTKSLVVPIHVVYNLSTHKYELHFESHFDAYPSGDMYHDLKLMNEYLERFLSAHPEQYMWFLKFFKSLPNDQYVNIYEHLAKGAISKEDIELYRSRRKSLSTDENTIK